MEYSRGLSLFKPVYDEVDWHTPLRRNIDCIDFLLNAVRKNNYCIDDILIPEMGRAAGDDVNLLDLHCEGDGYCKIGAYEQYFNPITGEGTEYYSIPVNSFYFLYLASSGMQFTEDLPSPYADYCPIATVLSDDMGIVFIKDYRIIHSDQNPSPE